MVAEMVAPSDEVVDLESLSLDELRHELVTVNGEIEAIKTQLEDLTRPSRLGPVRFAEWRQRARYALSKRKEERAAICELIHSAEVERAEAHREMRRLRASNNGRTTLEEARARLEEHVRADRNEERRRALVEAVHGGGGVEGLLFRLSCVFRRAIGDGNPLPATLSQEDRDTLRDVNDYLVGTYGKAGLRAARQGRLTAENDGGAPCTSSD